jgi:D-beta-D-heptose 7-phosphate kinase/D-beta-D-heptose 1-phosphate adenosyltransferase
MSSSLEPLLAIVERFGKPRARIMLIGDVMLDEYIYGNADRLSPEAPVPVVQEKYREQRPGGAGNVAAGLAALQAEVLCVSVCGADLQGNYLLDLFMNMGVRTEGIVRCKDRPTTSKTRLVGLAQHRHPQQMLRLDQETTAPVSEEHQRELMAYIEKELPSCAALAVEDYAKGLLTPDFCRRVIRYARELGKPVLVDPALIADYSKYEGASTITPNRFEAEKASGLKAGDSLDQVPQMAEVLLKRHHLETALLTLDRHGMYLLEKGDLEGANAGAKGGAGTHIPTRPRTVYDVSGAGDMVLAMLVMAVAHGATWKQAAALANVAGGLEVEKFGTVAIKKEEVIDELQRMDNDTRGKERTVPQLVKDLERRRRESPMGKVVFTNGVFDILHAGHVKYLEFARQQGDCLVIGVNSDESVKRLKGPERPVNSLADRMAVLAGLQAVDFVVSFGEDTPEKLIEAVMPDVLVKGEDYKVDQVVGREIVEKRGGKVVLAPFLAGRSTTGTIERMKGQQ